MKAQALGVEIRFAAMHLERPPKIRLYFDVKIDNRWGTPRWCLLPDYLPLGGDEARYAVDGLDVYLLGRRERVVVGQALALPGGGRITLRQFPILFWGDEIPDAVTIEVSAAKEILIGGAPAATWFGLDPLSDAEADVDANVLAEQKEVYLTRHAAGGKAVPVSLRGVETMQLEVRIPP